MPATLRSIRIDEATWELASRERRQEWLVAVEELVHTHHFSLAAEEFLLHVRPGDAGVLFAAADEGGRPLADVLLPTEKLAPHFTEYLAICREMGRAQAAATARLEALDIAKRICHDEAATTVGELCRPLGPDHATARRLFTLLVTLHVDTTRLVLPHHRC